MKFSFILVATIGLFFYAHSQDKAIEIKPLSIGDKVPDLQFANMVNYHLPKAKLSDFKGKLVILDFWATWCSPCVAALPKMQALQQQFKDKIQVLAITEQSMKTIEPFLKRMNAAKELSSIPIVINGTSITRHFKFAYIPHEIWIGPDGTIKAITSEQYVSSDNIAKMLNNEKVNWPVKDNEEKLDKDMPLYTVSENAKGIRFYSGFTSYIGGLPAIVRTVNDTVAKTKRYNVYNHSILSLYSLLFNKSPQFENPKYCVLNVADSSRLIYDKHLLYRDVWNANNLYSYEASFSSSYGKATINDKLKNDLDFYFKLDSKMEKRKIRCLILKKVGSLQPIAIDTAGLPAHALSKDVQGNYRYSQKNTWLSYFVEAMNKDAWANKLPLMIDETGIRGKMSIELELGKAIGDIQAIREQLSKYGIDLIEEERELEMLILSNK